MHHQGIVCRYPPILESAIEIALMDYPLLFSEPKQELFMH
jgi:hypothetical protein